MLQIPLPTAYRIARAHRLEGRMEALAKGGRNEARCKADNEMREFLQEELQQNPFLTLGDMARRLGEQFPDKPRVSYKTVDRMLAGLLYTVKLATKATDIRRSTNSAANIEARRDYAEFMLGLQPHARIVFLDETGYNLWTRRSQGRALVGRPLKRTVTTQRGPNVTVCMAIAAEFGLVHSTVQRGGQTIGRFQAFMNELCERCSDLDHVNQWLIVMDGPHVHRAVHIAEQFQHQVSIHILPPYSPFLNPAEFANSALKAKIKTLLADPAIAEEEAAAPDGLSMEDWRFMLLERVAREAIDVITAEKAAAWELKCSRLFGRCLQLEQF